ncbi:DUF6114 domain-containing protein [Streptomyces odonnellii]|uniref:DUF6114 domain-containing protein n=1 Tax=Streptomyces odonnellii TaxID=1417980 RepID=UPI0006253D34|nr:DUF6114 domain-containing protein [Streptomyces odonnellii]
MSAESTGSRGFTYWRLRFRVWRGTRPFWAGLFTLLGGLPISYFPYAQLHLGNLTLAMSTTAGAGSLIIGVLLVTLGLTMWFHSIVRVFAGVAAILLALVSIPVSNIGGFLLGFLFALIGGALSISWAPGKPPRPAAEHHHTPHLSPESHSAGEPFPVPRDGEDPNVTETTAQANGGRNSAG